MAKASRKITPTSLTPPFPADLIDLDTHPDGTLMRNCAEATKLLDAIAIALVSDALRLGVL
jgi:hypothetical protein